MGIGDILKTFVCENNSLKVLLRSFQICSQVVHDINDLIFQNFSAVISFRDWKVFFLWISRQVQKVNCSYFSYSSNNFRRLWLFSVRVWSKLKRILKFIAYTFHSSLYSFISTVFSAKVSNLVLALFHFKVGKKYWT